MGFKGWLMGPKVTHAMGDAVVGVGGVPYNFDHLEFNVVEPASFRSAAELRNH